MLMSEMIPTDVLQERDYMVLISECRAATVRFAEASRAAKAATEALQEARARVDQARDEQGRALLAMREAMLGDLLPLPQDQWL